MWPLKLTMEQFCSVGIWPCVVYLSVSNISPLRTVYLGTIVLGMLAAALIS